MLGRETFEKVRVSLENARREGKSFGEIRRIARALGVKVEFTGHNSADGRAARRRVRQMERGIIPALCEQCGQGCPSGRTPRLCDQCLAAKWGSGVSL